MKHVKKKGSTGDLSGAAAEIPPNPTSVTSPTTPSTPKTNNGSAPSLWPITADVDDGAVGSTENVEVVRTYMFYTRVVGNWVKFHFFFTNIW